MAGDILIIKKKGNKVGLKITQEMRAGYAPDGHIIINLKDYKDVALMFCDLRDLYNVNIDKAIEEYEKNKTRLWPF